MTDNTVTLRLEVPQEFVESLHEYRDRERSEQIAHLEAKWPNQAERLRRTMDQQEGSTNAPEIALDIICNEIGYEVD
jgi:predicted ribosome quality control (RQC) complex YloA/Tae2 family protein